MPINNGKNKGFSFLQYKFPREAKQALQNLNGLTICGRSITCDWALDKQYFNKKEKARELFKKKLINSNVDGKRSNINFSENLFLYKLNDLKDQNTEYKSKKYKIKIEVQNIYHRSSFELTLKNNIGKNKEMLNFWKKDTIFFQAFRFRVKKKILKDKFKIFDKIEYLLFTIDKHLKKLKQIGFIQFKETKAVKKILSKKKYLKPIVLNMKKDLETRCSFEKLLYITLSSGGGNLSEKEKKTPYVFEKKDNDEKKPFRLTNKEKNITYSSFKQQSNLLENFNFSVSKVRLTIQKLPINMNERELKQMFRLTANILRKKADFNFKYLTPKIIQLKLSEIRLRKIKLVNPDH